MLESEKEKLVQELNELSEWRPWTKARMVEIAKILLADHYGYTRKDINIKKEE